MAGEAPNAAQATYWNETAGPTWAELQAQLDVQLQGVGERGITALAPKPGERILDVGCGAGASSLSLAKAVTPGGEVVGVDISATLLEVARERAKGTVGLTFLEADAQTYALEAARFDAIFSRFGVMFFADPVAAFRNIRGALKPGGRMVFVCWRSPAESPILSLPLAAAAPHLPPLPPPDPEAPGPFAFADPDKVRRTLAAAGFAAVTLTPLDIKMGSGDMATTLHLAQRVGPLGGLLRENPDKRDAVIAAVRAALEPYDGPDGVRLDSGTWIVAARAPS